MAQSLSQILLHVIFSTKDREPTIPPELEDELYRYLASACNAHGSHAFRIGQLSDPVSLGEPRRPGNGQAALY
jgi:putative transposase